MKFTDVRIRKVDKEDTKLRAVASVTIDDSFVIHDIKVIEGTDGLFIAMPSKKSNDGEYRDIAHPISQAARENIQRLILEGYEKELAKLISTIEKKMKKAAADLNFEAAAELRDKMTELKKIYIDMTSGL